VSDDIVPPASGTNDPLAEVTLPRWKMNAILNGVFGRALSDIAREDSAAAKDQQPRGVGDPDSSAPPLAADADASFTGSGFDNSPALVYGKDTVAPDPAVPSISGAPLMDPAAEEQEREQLMAELLDKVNADIDALDERLTAYEDRCAAEAKSAEALALAESLAETNPEALNAMLEPLKKVPDELRRFN
jgi:hypothetical protein